MKNYLDAISKLSIIFLHAHIYKVFRHEIDKLRQRYLGNEAESIHDIYIYYIFCLE